MPQNNFWLDSPILFNSLLNDNYHEFVKKMFENEHLINIPNKNKEYLLHYCCFYGIIDKYYALSNFNAKPHLTKEKNTLLHYASIGGLDNFLIVELVKSGISPIKSNNYGQTSLHMAKNEPISHYLNLWCMRNNINIMDLLDKKGNTVAHGCYELGFHESAQYWVSNYPEMGLIKNNDMNLYHEVVQKESNFCQYQ